jgi:hypothetical protein
MLTTCAVWVLLLAGIQRAPSTAAQTPPPTFPAAAPWRRHIHTATCSLPPTAQLRHPPPAQHPPSVFPSPPPTQCPAAASHTQGSPSAHFHYRLPPPPATALPHYSSHPGCRHSTPANSTAAAADRRPQPPQPPPSCRCRRRLQQPEPSLCQRLRPPPHPAMGQKAQQHQCRPAPNVLPRGDRI